MDAHTAVKGFFIISGFYMALILDQKYGRSAAGIRAFAINRFLRLYPLYIVVLALTIGWYVVRLATLGARTPSQAIFSMNEVLAGWRVWAIWLSNVSLLGLDFICAWDWVPEKGFAFLQGSANPPIEGTVTMGATVWVIQAWSISMEILFYLCAPFLSRRKS
jgi:peptidoglycan/LPS O-acetylase OafA/YrhL